MLETHGLSIGYKIKKTNIILLSGLNLYVKRGETVALFGINGSGKSSLLRSLSAMQTCLDGEIILSGKKIKSYSTKALARKLSFVSTEIIKIKHLKVEELVKLARFTYTSGTGRMNTEEKKIIKNALKLIGMSDYAKKNINELSEGERQKIMIARAIAQDTDIIILDEPAAFLDTENKYSVYEILQNLAVEKKKSLIYSTHDLSFALKNADKIWIIKNKKIIQGAPEDLIIKNIFSDIFNIRKIAFNKETYNFDYKSKLIKPIYVVDNFNNKIIYKLTTNALNRKGFFISNKRTKITVIIISENKKPAWKLINNEIENISYSIYNLIKNIDENC